MNFIALRIIPEAHLGLAVIAVDCSQFVGVTLPSVHAVLSQNALVTGVSVEEQSKPKHYIYNLIRLVLIFSIKNVWEK